MNVGCALSVFEILRVLIFGFLVGAIPNLYFWYKYLLLKKEPKNPKQILKTFYFSELIKLLIAIVLLLWLFSYAHHLIFFAVIGFLGSYFITIAVIATAVCA